MSEFPIPGPRSPTPAASALLAFVSGLLGALLVSWGQFVLGGTLLALSTLWLRWPHSVWRSETIPLARRARNYGLIAVCVLGVVFRFHRLEIGGVWGDDAINGLLALDVLEGRVSSPLELVQHSYSHFHALSNYLIAAAFRAVGTGEAGLRLPGALLNALAVPIFYALVSPLFGRRVALLSALFFATSPVQVAHSKVLLQVGLGEVFLLAALALLVRGLIGGYRSLIVLAAVPLALTAYTYHSAKLAPLIAAVLVASAWRDRVRREELQRSVAIGSLLFLLLLIPAIVSYWQQPAALVGRVSQVSLWRDLQNQHSLRPLWDAIWRTLMIFHYRQGPKYHWFGIGTDPALNLVTGFLAVHGLTESIARRCDVRHRFLLLWFAIGLLPGVLSIDAPLVYRVLLAVPPVYIWAALALDRTTSYLSSAAAVPWSRWSQRALTASRVLAACLVLAVPVIDFNYFFYRVYTHDGFRWYQCSRMVEMARRLKQLGPGWTGYVVSSLFQSDYETVHFFSRAWGLDVRDVSKLSEVLPVHEVDQGVLFVVDRSLSKFVPIFETYYPGIRPEALHEPPARTWWLDRFLPLAPAREPRPVLTFFAVPRRAAQSLQGVTATYFAGDGTPLFTETGPELSQKEPPRLREVPSRARWSASIYVPASGTYGITLTSAGPGRAWIDGTEIVSSQSTNGTLELNEGIHSFAAEVEVGGAPLFDLRWRPPGRDATEAIPPWYLFRDPALQSP